MDKDSKLLTEAYVSKINTPFARWWNRWLKENGHKTFTVDVVKQAAIEAWNMSQIEAPRQTGGDNFVGPRGIMG